MDGIETEHTSAASHAESHSAGSRSAESRIESHDNAHGPDRSGVTQRDEHLPKAEQSLSADGGSQRSGSLEAKGDDSLARAATAPISQLDMAKELGRALDSAAAAKIREAEAFADKEIAAAEKVVREKIGAVAEKAQEIADTVEKKAAEIRESARQADQT